MILLISYGAGHIAIISRLYEFLVAKKHNVKILPLTTATVVCKKKKYDYIKISDHVDYSLLNKDHHDFIKKISNENHNKEVGLDYEHTKAYYTIGLLPLIKKFGITKTKKIYEKKNRLSFVYENFAKKIISEIKPKLVITTNVPRMELAFRKIAFKNKIKVFSIDDLAGYYGPKRNSHFSDKIFVDNDRAINNLKRDGFKGEIIKSGNPVFDDIIKLAKNHKDKFEPSNLLIILQPGIRNMEKNLVENFDNRFYANFFKNLDSTNFLKNFNKVSVRFHPSMKQEYFWKNNKIKIDKYESLHDSLLNHGSVIGFSSTALREAYILGNFVYSLSFGENYFNIDVPTVGNIDFGGNFEIKTKPKLIKNFSKKQPAISVIYKYIANEIYDN